MQIRDSLPPDERERQEPEEEPSARREQMRQNRHAGSMSIWRRSMGSP